MRGGALRAVLFQCLCQGKARCFSQPFGFPGDHGQALVQEGGFQGGIGAPGNVVPGGEISQQLLRAAEDPCVGPAAA